MAGGCSAAHFWWEGGKKKGEKKKSNPMLHKLLKGLNLFITRDYDLSDASINESFI